MNIFNKVTLQSLRKNKTRTIVTIIGIMLSAAMICAVTTFTSSMQNYALNYTIYNDGDWHGSAERVNFEPCKKINSTGKVSDSAYNQILGYARIDSINDFKPYMYVIGGSSTSFFEMMPVHLVSGNYPKNANELIVPEHVLYNGGLKYNIGDTITLEIGERMLDGYAMTQNNPCYIWSEKEKKDVLNGEVIEVRETRTYTIVGIYERPSFEEFTAPGYTAITVCDKAFDGKYLFDVYFKMKNPSQVYSFMQELKLDGSYNTDVLMLSGVSKYSSFSSVLISLAAIVIALIMFGSISLIYNAFAISVSERTKQFGLLSSIGATKKQLKKMVLFEALTVSVVGIPLGVGVGIAGIAITLLLIGNKFASIFIDYKVPMRICLSWEAIVIAVIVALITVLISAWIPSKRATKVSAVDAIRQSADIKAKNKKVRTSKLAYKLFGLPGVIAGKHYKRNKRKYRATVVSLFVSIVLFVSASAFSDYLIESVTGGFGPKEYDITYIMFEDDNVNRNAIENIFKLLSSDKNVTGGAYLTCGNFNGSISKNDVTDEFLKLEETQDSNNQAFKAIRGYLYFVNDSEFDKIIKKHHLDRNTYYNSKDPLGIALDNNIQFDVTQGKYITLDTLKGDSCEILCNAQREYNGYYCVNIKKDENGKVFVCYQSFTDENDIMEIPEEDAYVQYTLRTGKTITQAPFYIDRSMSGDIKFLYPMSMFKYVMPEGSWSSGNYFSFYLQSDNHLASYNNLKTVLFENDLPDNLADVAEDEETNRNVVTVIQVFSFGFIILISLIAAANVFNTVSTNISLRRREFAMLKSVGMTKKGFNKMMNYECLLYGSKALLLGLPVSALFTYLIYMAISDGFETTYHLPWGAIGISVLSVFLVVFATMVYSMSKIKKENPIDALKNENL